MKNPVLIAIIIVLLLTTCFFWQRSRELSSRLDLIQQRIGKAKARMEDMAERQRTMAAELKAAAMEPGGARVAIVLDDWGYNLRNLKQALALKGPLTFSILPGLPYSERIARAARENGDEVILHLPLEPYEDLPLEENTIMSDMTEDEIAEKLELSMSSVPGLKGISNHMGSKATSDRRVMSVIFRKLKPEDLYFMDSFVTSGSVCGELCREMGVKFASRSVFLDNSLDTGYIKGQIKELARQAVATGWAIGVGHDRAATIAALGETLPELREMGINIVPVSELAE
jgi:hypothetical protein